MDSALTFVNFGFTYKAQAEPTLFNIDLTVRRGEKICVLGPSGSGKSTLANCINGLIPHAFPGRMTGSLFVTGEDSRILDIFSLSKKVGTVLQDTDGQFVGLSAGEDIAFAAENDMVPVDEMHRRVRAAAELVQIEDFLSKQPQELSGGQKQRVSMAGVLLDEVEILLFDEPLANLDPAAGKQAIELIDELHRKTGKTILIVEHRLEDVLHREVDRIVVMDGGRITADDTPAAVLSSGILGRTGIREPLYLGALKYAGLSFGPADHPEDLRQVRFDAGALRAWDEAMADPEAGEGAAPLLEIRDLSFRYESGLSTGTGAATKTAAGTGAVAGDATGGNAADSGGRIGAGAATKTAAGTGGVVGDAARDNAAGNGGRTGVEGNGTPPSGAGPALDHVSFTVNRGDCLALVGKNGAGKSSLAALVCGFYKHRPETIFFDGRDMAELSIKERADRVGYVMQNPNHMISFPLIYDEAALGLRARGMAEGEIRDRVHDIFRVCGLYPFRAWPVSALSFGQKKRLTIASILVLGPSLLILDEPTAGQDFRHYSEIMEFLLDLNRKQGVTLLLITHDMHLMLEYCNRAVVIAGGRIVAGGAADGNALTPAAALTDDRIVEAASLKRTSLYDLALRAGLDDPKRFVGRFIRHDREARTRRRGAGGPGGFPLPGAADRSEARESAAAGGLGRAGAETPVSRFMLSYVERPSPVHALSGAVKLIVFLLWSIIAMTGYDTRVMGVMALMGIVLFVVSGMKLSEVSFIFKMLALFMGFNLAGIYLFAPEQGVAVYGSRHLLLEGMGRFTLTAEQLFYEFNIFLKYCMIVPAAILLIVTTHPSEFAASLNRIGVHYYLAYAVSLTLRYIPDVQRDYLAISHAQQARGIELSRKTSLFKRVKGAAVILLPLIFSTLDRIDVVSRAMELRSFGKYKKRTWYSGRPFSRADIAVLAVSAALFAFGMWFIFRDGSRFYNPFTG